MKPFIRWLGSLGIGSALLLSANAHADGDRVSLFGSTIMYGGTADQSLAGATGFALTFLSEKPKKGFRLSLGSELEFASGSASTATTPPTSIIAGQLLIGASYSPFETPFVRPFLSVHPALGWVYATFDATSQKNIGLAYGAIISASAEIRFKKQEAGLSLRVGTGYRILKSSIAGSGSLDLDALMLNVGITF